MSPWNVHGSKWCRDELRRFGDATASSNHFFSIPPPTSSLNPSSNSHSADSLSILDFTPSSAREAFFAHTDGANGTKRRRKEELNVTIGKKSGRERSSWKTLLTLNALKQTVEVSSLSRGSGLRWKAIESVTEPSFKALQSLATCGRPGNGENVNRRSIAALIAAAASCTRRVYHVGAGEHSDGMRWSSCSSLLRTLQAFHEKKEATLEEKKKNKFLCCANCLHFKMSTLWQKFIAMNHRHGAGRADFKESDNGICFCAACEEQSCTRENEATSGMIHHFRGTMRLIHCMMIQANGEFSSA